MVPGAARLGAAWGETAPLHLALMGGLGLGVLAVLAIAGRFHTGQDLGLNGMTRGAFLLAGMAVLLRVLPEIAEQFRTLVNETKGSSDAVVVSFNLLGEAFALQKVPRAVRGRFLARKKGARAAEDAARKEVQA